MRRAGELFGRWNFGAAKLTDYRIFCLGLRHNLPSPAFWARPLPPKDGHDHCLNIRIHDVSSREP